MTNSSRRTRVALGAYAALLTTNGIVSLRAARAADWPRFRGDSLNSGVSSEQLAPPLTLLWRHTAGAQNGNNSAPIVVGDTAYFTTRTSIRGGGAIFAVDVRTGARKWSFPNGETGLIENHYFGTTPSVVDGKLYIGASNGMLYVLDAETGRKVQQEFSMGTDIKSSPVLSNGILYFGSSSGTFYALNPATGEQAWRQLYKTNSPIISAPIIADGLIFFLSADNTVHALNQSSGLMRWKYRLRFKFDPDAAVYSDGTLYIPSGPSLYALQPRSGNLRWERQLPLDILTAPVAVNGVIYVSCKEEGGNGARLYAIRQSNGREVWEQSVALPYVPTAAPVVAGNIIYIPANRGTIVAVSREDGKLLWQYRLPFSSNRPLPSSGTTGSVGGFPGGSSGGFPGGGGPPGGGAGGAGRGRGGAAGGARGGNEGGGGGGFGGSGGPGGFGGANAVSRPKTETSIAAPLAVSGGALYIVSDDGSLSALRNDAPDTTAPFESDRYPRVGTSVNGRPPLVIAVKVNDVGSGVDPSTLVMKVDDEEVPVKYDASTSLAYYQTKSTGKIVDPPLIDGAHTVTVQAKDWRGNAAEITWSFTVDNTLPAKGNPTPPTLPREIAPNPPPRNNSQPRGGFRRGSSGGFPGAGGTPGGGIGTSGRL